MRRRDDASHQNKKLMTDELNLKYPGVSVDILSMDTYPDDGRHLKMEIWLPNWKRLPFEITKGEDTFYWIDPVTRQERQTRPQYWYVGVDFETDHLLFDGNFRPKLFLKPEKAVYYAVNQYTKALNNKLDELRAAKR